jgi:hypothetical protein
MTMAISLPSSVPMVCVQRETRLHASEERVGTQLCSVPPDIVRLIARSVDDPRQRAYLYSTCRALYTLSETDEDFQRIRDDMSISYTGNRKDIAKTLYHFTRRHNRGFVTYVCRIIEVIPLIKRVSYWNTGIKAAIQSDPTHSEGCRSDMIDLFVNLFSTTWNIILRKASRELSANDWASLSCKKISSLKDTMAIAVQLKDGQVIRRLITLGASIEKGMMSAVKMGNRSLVDFFIRAGAHDWDGAIVRSPTIDLIRFFEAKITRDWQGIFKKALLRNNFVLIHFIIDRNLIAHAEALHYAVSHYRSSHCGTNTIYYLADRGVGGNTLKQNLRRVFDAVLEKREILILQSCSEKK